MARTKKDLKTRLAILSRKHNRWIWTMLLVRLLVTTVLFWGTVWPLLSVISGKRHWLWLLVAAAFGLLLFSAVGLLVHGRLKIDGYAEQFLKMINGRCKTPYTIEDLFRYKVVHKWIPRPAAFHIWGEYLIHSSYPKVDNRPRQAREAAEVAWQEQVDGLFREAISDLPNTIAGYRLKLRLRRAIGNKVMHWRDRHILILTVYSYFWPDADDIGEVKSRLGNWFSHVPSQPSRVEFKKELLSATKTHTAEAKPQPKPKRVPTPPLVKPAPEPQPRVLPEDRVIDLKKLRHEVLPREEIAALLPSHVNANLVWSVLISLLEPGKGIAIAGGWMRQESIIFQQVARIYAQEKWQYPGNKACKTVIDWLQRERVLNKRLHGRDFSLDFHVTGKSEVATQLCQFLNQAKPNGQVSLDGH